MKMAAAVHAYPLSQALYGQEQETASGAASAIKRPHHVHTALNYYNDPGDGSPPPAAYVGVPESYVQPTTSVPVTITDVSGHENEYSLDSNGFQFYRHPSQEKDFVDDDQIRKIYYPETEQLLKDA